MKTSLVHSVHVRTFSVVSCSIQRVSLVLAFLSVITWTPRLTSAADTKQRGTLRVSQPSLKCRYYFRGSTKKGHVCQSDRRSSCGLRRRGHPRDPPQIGDLIQRNVHQSLRENISKKLEVTITSLSPDLLPWAHEAYEKVLTAFDNQQTITPDELSALNTKQFIWSPSIGRVETAPLRTQAIYDASCR